MKSDPGYELLHIVHIPCGCVVFTIRDKALDETDQRTSLCDSHGREIYS